MGKVVTCQAALAADMPPEHALEGKEVSHDARSICEPVQDQSRKDTGKIAGISIPTDLLSETLTPKHGAPCMSQPAAGADP